MAPLNPVSTAAIARLRTYKPPPFPLWDRLPVSRRAAVLMLLYADRRGDLRVVITMRAASLRSFSGHAALPGGKADSVEETPYQIARREAWEEIGLPMDDSKIPAPFRIEQLCYLPMNLARTELIVRPCVAMLHATQPPIPTTTNLSSARAAAMPTVEDSLIPRLDAKEVAAVFSAPFHNFLRQTDEVDLQREHHHNRPLPPGKWYEGSWTKWHDEQWRMHFFHVPVNNQRVTKPKEVRRDRGEEIDAISEPGDDRNNNNTEESKPLAAIDEDSPGRFKVWGMTARMLVDAATVAYGEPPEFEHNSHFGDERLILGLDKMGRLGPKKQGGGLLTNEDLKKASDASKM
ncbi:NUDIX hydrolase domain-like protein [Podospora didyma]|uniref:NUDIX hydrolase domain-like protein n=1 Tax=Podospora didyma TaxID=330526 RepID=A0AAE0P6K1_9PEZI|nr:NUDIX hydrolase domain-like protein [Podospora didyma]